MDVEPGPGDESLARFTNVLQKAVASRPENRSGSGAGSFLRERIQEIIPICLQLELARIQRELALHAMDRIHRAVIAATESAQVIFFNEVAGAILKKNDGLRIERDYLIALRSSDTMEIRKSIQRAATEAIKAPAPVFSIGLPRPSLAADLVLQITSCSRKDSAIAGDDVRGIALIFVTDPEAYVAVEQDLLCRMYGLTKAEARLAGEIVAGKTPEEAADSLCVSIKTIRTHLHRIFLKTGTSRQSQLVAQLMRTIL